MLNELNNNKNHNSTCRCFRCFYSWYINFCFKKGFLFAYYNLNHVQNSESLKHFYACLHYYVFNCYHIVRKPFLFLYFLNFLPLLLLQQFCLLNSQWFQIYKNSLLSICLSFFCCFFLQIFNFDWKTFNQYCLNIRFYQQRAH